MQSSAAVGHTPAQSETHRGRTICNDLSVIAKVRSAGGAAATCPPQKTLTCAGHEASIRSLGDKGMLHSHNLKALKAEGMEQSCSVIMVLLEANEDIVTGIRSSTNSRRTVKLSLLPSGRTPPGISM